MTIREYQCSCATCRDMCRKFPCRPMPQEVAAMPAEVRARLMSQSNGNCLHGVPHLQAAAAGYEGREAPDFRPSWGVVGAPHPCTFHTADGLCELHGKCKPWEGRVASCTLGSADEEFQELKRAWKTPEGQQVLADWKKEQSQPGTQSKGTG